MNTILNMMVALYSFVIKPFLLLNNCSTVGPLHFNIFINVILKACSKFAFILYADYTTLNSTLDSFGNDTKKIQNSIISELKKVFKWLDVNKLCLNLSKSKFMLFQMPQ